MRVNAYLNFNGHCGDALQFYARCLNAKILSTLTFDSMPGSDVPKGWEKKIAHARLQVGDSVVLASDAPPQQFDGIKGFALSLTVPTPAEAERIFKALSDHGNVSMPLTETFWAQRFGMLTDRFGVSWMVNCDKPEQAA